jgi:hypothetical protein
MKINQIRLSESKKSRKQFLYKTHIIVLFLIAIFFSVNNTYAQNEKEVLEFLHSGTVTAQNKPVKIPIEIWNDLILMNVKINGHEARFMWDNGFSVSGIDNSLVGSYQLLTYNSISGQTATDGNNVKVNLDFLTCPKIEINGITISNTPFVKVDFRTMTLTKDLEIEGIIGASIINKLNWKFDFDNKYVEISEKPFSINNKDLVLPFKVIETNNSHVMPIAFNESKTDCLVDFGYNSDVIEINTANAKFFSKANATKTFGPSSVSVSGIAPIDTIYNIKDNFSWELSGKKLNAKPRISFTKASHNITIGNKLFRDNYNLIINTTETTVYAVSPRKKTDVIRSDKTYGYKLHIVDGVFKVLSIDSNINTVDGEVKLLDEVTSINGKLPADFKDNHSLRSYQKQLLEKKDKMILKFKNGKEIILMPQPGIEYKFNAEKGSW